MLLRSSGFECVGLVADGLEATALLSGETMLGAAASPRLPQVILMDVNMVRSASCLLLPVPERTIIARP